ncbi:MAG: hypothetical protein DRP01_00620 [Archaeoglobales archaeon]|nr:MAG: hypothetical protein DRP01_00620 [Archaeoglobales archaeon]
MSISRRCLGSLKRLLRKEARNLAETKKELEDLYSIIDEIFDENDVIDYCINQAYDLYSFVDLVFDAKECSREELRRLILTAVDRADEFST